MKQLEKKGYFINKDGKDSRDLYKAPKRKSSDGDEEMKDDSPKKKSAKPTKSTKEDRKSQEMYDENVCKPKRPMTSCF
jgi:hypothetical protein